MAEQDAIDDDRTARAAADVETALRAFIADHPEAMVAAADVDSGVGLVPLPPSLGVPPGQVAPTDGMGRVAADDRPTVARVWADARLRGWASAPIRLDGSETPGTLYAFDVRVSLGVTVLVYLPGVSPDRPRLARAEVPAGPRTARCTKDAGGVYLSTGPGFAEMLGWPPAEVLGRRVVEYVHPEDRDAAVAMWLETLEAPGPGPRIRLRHRHRDGSWLWVEVANYNRLGEPAHGDVLTEMVDVSEEVAAGEALRAREQLLAQLTDTVPVGLFHADPRGRLLFVNRQLCRMTGIREAATLAEQLSSVDGADVGDVEAAARTAAGGTACDIEVTLRPAGQLPRHATLRLRPLTDGFGRPAGFTGCLEDVTEMVRTRRDLQARAERDSLTGCLNRAALLSALQDILDEPVGEGTAVMFIDLDGFKPINDRLGHAAGDDLLVGVARRLRSAVRAADVLGRFGGDEFVVVCPGVRSPEQALDAARSLSRRSFGATVDGETIVAASVGVAWTGLPGADAAALVGAADRAMYEAKRSGGGEPMLDRDDGRRDRRSAGAA